MTVESKKYYPLFTIEIFVLILLGFTEGLHHEPWADEAQAWLIARDCGSLTELIGAVRYEGTPPLWHILIKAFQFIGITYEYFFVIPLILAIIGTMLLLFKCDTLLSIKLLLPFSYFILYQNIAVSRSYSLVFPILMLLASR